MTSDDHLDRLARLAGIEPHYFDIWGREHKTTPDGKRLLLRALGIPAQDLAEITASITDLELQPWRRPLPPVLVVREGEPLCVPVSLPARLKEREFACELMEESGARQRFTFRLTTLRVITTRTVDGEPMQRRMLELPATLPPGYHDLHLADVNASPMRLIVAPRRCFMPPSLHDGGRAWGIAAHIYALRSERGYGIGDFSDLADLAEIAGHLGAATIGINPLHALFPQLPEQASPYSPSSRVFLNPIYIDVESVPGFADCREARSVIEASAGVLAAARSAAFVDYSAVTALKRRVLEALHRHHLDHPGTAADAALGRFREQHGERLRRFAIFEALSERFSGLPWPQWPPRYRDPRSIEVAVFAQLHPEQIAFHEYLQWLADRQLAAVAQRAGAAALDIGLYCDLAVGVDPNGADAWSEQDVVVATASVGAPPDPFNLLGQDWGTPPLHPHVIRERAYEPFVAMLRANMQHAGALRIDHAMGLLHLYWIPVGGPASAGAYIQYPFDDLLGILALESQRNRCLIIGEDLGTVPEGFREVMAQNDILSYRVLYFEKEGDRFKNPKEYPELALACVTTHDLATLSGFWKGADLDLRRRLALYPSKTVENNERAARNRDRELLLTALRGENLLPSGSVADDNGAGPSPALIVAVHEFLGRSPAKLLMVQIDDLTLEEEQLNLPGTVEERPNWRRRLSIDLRDLAAAPLVKALRAALADREAANPSSEASAAMAPPRHQPSL